MGRRAIGIVAAFAVGIAACAAPAPSPSGSSPATPTHASATPSATPPAFYAPPPGPGAPFQIQLDGGVPDDPGAALVIVDNEVPADAVATLHATGAYVVCYLSVGTSEEYRPDVGDFPESVLGAPLPDWPDERYVDLRALDVLGPIWAARLDACAAKGFDAVDPDNIDAFENDSGFPLTADDAVAAYAWLADAAHARGMAVGQKNAPSLAGRLVGLADFAVTEECLTQGWCGEVAAYVDAGKPVLAIEYVEDGATLARWCAEAGAARLSLLVTTLDLPGTGERCDPA